MGNLNRVTGRYVLSVKSYQEAVALYRSALARQPRFFRGHLELGKLLMQAGNQAAARGEFQAAATLSDADDDRGTADEARRFLK